MKKFEVEFRRTSFITVTVEAESRDEAWEKAWQEVDQTYIGDANWETESIEEVGDAA